MSDAEPPPTVWTTAPARPGELFPVAWRGWRKFLAAAVTTALVGVMAGVAAWVRPLPTPYFVPLWVTQYRSPAIPDRSEADADRDAVRAAGLFPRGANAYSSQEAVLLAREFDQLARLPATERLVVYLSGFARVRPDGDVELIPADAEPPTGRDGLSVRDILRKVKAAPPRAKLVVLDLGGPPPDPRSGYLWTDPAAHVAGLVAAAEAEQQTKSPGAAPDWLVLCSAAPGQIPHGSRVLGRSVFGYYFELGLRGDAIPYQPAGHATGRRVSARGLAAYLQVRVDRWVRTTVGRRQTPVLLGDGPDFDLASATGGAAETPGVAADTPLRDGWDTLAVWATDGSLSDGPRVYRRLQDQVRLAQTGRRFGAANDRGSADLANDVVRYRRDMAAARAAPARPSQVVSVALARALGSADDPSAAKAVDELVAAAATGVNLPKAEQDAGLAKAIAAFVKATADKPAFAVESTVVARLSVAAANPAEVQLLDRALRERKLPLAYIETYFLCRLAELSRRIPATQWPADIARSATAAVTGYEAAAARLDVYAWTSSVLRDAAQSRWTGEILLEFWGSVPPEETAAKFHDAVRLSAAVTAFADAYTNARRVADIAVVGLVAEAAVLEEFPDRVPLWEGRVRSVAALLPLLTPPVTPPDAAGLLDRADQLRRAADATAGQTVALDQVTGAGDVDWAVSAAAADPPQPGVVRRIELLLDLPRLAPDRRAALVGAAAGLAKRLADLATAADTADAAASRMTPTLPFAAEEGLAERRASATRAAVRSGCHLTILRLAGMPPAVLDPLAKLRDTAVRDGPDSPAWADLSIGLGRAWSTGMADLLRDASPDRLDLLAMILPAYTVSAFDVPGADTRVAARRKAWADFFGWSGAVHRQVARAGFDRDFLELVASAEIAVGTETPVPAPVAVFDDSPPLVLTADRSVAEVRITFRHPGAVTGDPVLVRALPPGDALRVTAETGHVRPDPAGGGTVGQLVVRATVANPASPGAIPDGVLVELRAGNRVGYVRIPVDAGRLVNPVEIFVDRVPADPVGLSDDIRVRPGAGENLFVFVRNRGTTKRDVVVRLVPLAGAVAPIETKVGVGPGETKLAPFAGGPPVPPAPVTKAAPGFDLPGHVRIDVADAADPGNVVQTRTLRLAASEPFEYADLSAAVFDPVAPPDRPVNRLAVTLRATRDLGTTPSNADLVVDPVLVPGLRGIRAGRLAGRVPPDGRPLVLDATGLVLDPEALRQGEVSVTVDGVTRAFRLKVDFARSGPPVSPTVDTSPNLDLRSVPPPLPGRSVAFRVGADRVPPGATLDARLVRHDQGRDPTTEATQTFPASRHRRATVTPRAGGVLVAATIADWDVAWDVPQLLGRRTVVARLVAADKTVLATKEIPVVLDDSPPTAPDFRNVPDQAKKGSALPVTVDVTDPESGIAAVSVFVGKPAPDGKPLPGTAVVPGVRSPTDATWAATVPLPKDKVGPVDVTCVAVNGAGLSSSATVSVEVVEMLPETLGSVAGRLLEGDRPQDGIAVTLSDAKGTALFRATTDANGAYLFDGLKPGAYQLSAEKVATRRKATATATVTGGVRAVVDLSLYLSP